MPLLRLSLIPALLVTASFAQIAPEAVNPPGKPTLDQLKVAALDAETQLPTATSAPKNYFEITEAQRQRLQQFLPRTLLKLDRRQRIHFVVIGDVSLNGATAGAGVDPLLHSFPSVFAEQLASQFYYTGGVRLVRPGSSLAPKERPIMGPELVLQPVRATSMLQATAAMTSEGFQGAPDAVILALGFEDSFNDTPLADVESALRGLIGVVRSKKIEIIVTAPMLQAAEPAESSLASTRGITSVLRDVCADEGVLFSDLGDFSRLIAPPQGIQETHRSFDALVRQYQTQLNVEPQGRIATAGTSLHASMGRVLFEDVMDGQPAVPWQLSNITSKLEPTGKLTLSAELMNEGKTPLQLTVLPLVTSWQPQDASPEITLAAGTRQTINITYRNSRPLTESTLRLPILIISGSTARIHDLTTPLTPISVTWYSRTTFNHEGIFSPGIEITNQSQQKVTVNWELTFNGQKHAGKAALEPEGHESLDLKLELPITGAAPIRQRLPLTLSIDTNGIKQTFDRQLELVRNVGLKQSIPLTAADGKPTEATVRFDADGQRLFLTCDLNGIDLNDDSDTGRAFDVMLDLDARSYGKRLTAGATAAIRIHGKAADGDAKVEKLAVWAFGTGYAANYDEKEIKATLSSTPSGLRRLTISLPRTYLYNHEWALDNGNSQIGINFRLAAADRSFFITSSNRHPTDAESLTVLELSEKPTQRATVRVE